MSKSKPTLVRLSEMTPGQKGDFFALLIERTRGARRDGKPYYTCRFRDQARVVTCMVWSDGDWFAECDASWREGTFYKMRAAYDEHVKYGPQIEIEKIRPVNDEDKATDFDASEFVDATRYDVEAMFQELWTVAETHIGDVPLRRLVMTILDLKKAQLKQVPATLKHFFPFAGGLLEHILSVTHSCIHLADKYVGHYPDMQPPLNRDLVVAGAILHDIGRTVEFNDNIASAELTTAGRMFGHLMLGRDLVRDTARELGDVNPELVLMLEHIVVTHLALPEWGSPKLPLIPECLIIHHADDLDAKLEMYARCLSRDKETGDFTARDPMLGRQLFKGRKV